ncbi:MAG: polysaccharide deacetylase family protein [Firmicutes bacterium]|nr:polysaccharide deacetylase family protein [Bacillota bacterium]
MRHRMFGTINGRKLLCILILIMLFPLALNFATKNRLKKEPVIAEGVELLGKPLGGLTLTSAKTVLEQMASVHQVPPVNAVIDEETKGVIPEINGLVIDVEETMHKLLVAQEGESVEPYYRQVAAETGLQDFPEYPIYRGNPEKKQVAFLINVAWGNEYLPALLAALKEAKAQGTFFLVGRWVEGNQREAQMIAEAGFEIASHGYSDAISLQQADKEVIDADLRKATEIIEAVCKVKPQFFSPHRGELSPLVLQVAAAQNLRVIMWSLDTVDWQLPGVEKMLAKVLNNVQGGDLILMHPTEQTAEFLRLVIPELRNLGLEPVTLSTLLNPERQVKE